VSLNRGWRGGRHHGDVEILFWLVPPALVTLVAMIWVSWIGRARPEGVERDEAAQERFAAAILREHPGSVRTRTTTRDRSTGIAVRPSRSNPAGNPPRNPPRNPLGGPPRKPLGDPPGNPTDPGGASRPSTRRTA
jgi:hypothetical protein